MLKAVLFDVGGTLHTVQNNDALRLAFAKRLADRLSVYDIHLDTDPALLSNMLQTNAEAYKHWSEKSLAELPQVRIWNEYYLTEFHIGEEKLLPIAEELSFLYDYARVCNKRRPHMKETMQALLDRALPGLSAISSPPRLCHILREYGIEGSMECVDVQRGRLPARFAHLPNRHGTVRCICGRNAYVGDSSPRWAREMGLPQIRSTTPSLHTRDAHQSQAPTCRIISTN